MTWHGLAKGLLYCAGMLSGVAAGNLFYLERVPSGAAMLVLTAVFLFYAMSNLSLSRPADDSGEDSDLNAERVLADMAIILAESAISGAKHIGRTSPCSAAEIDRIEDTIMPLLSSLSVSAKERGRLSKELEDLKTRTRQLDGRRAISRRF
ncbi:hypothetical protein FACS1894187_23850 [Synergistales bacterium]|nr:hypothetical protein FACS1894187_23850 [Synergistales bacterium]